ncbi:MAG TPA: nuclear transport factor 2 family protein [Pyrinomonadaceae bacterium]|nr:nuclear transport factor 2 family protein [Pyrinomonadaceae bacterium]
MSADNVELIRRGYEAYARRDFAAVFALLHPEVEIYQTASLPWGGTYRGQEQAREFFRRLSEQTEGGPEPSEFIAAGDDVVATGRLRGRVRANGRPFDLAIAHLWTVREGKIVRFAAYIDTPAMLSALGGDGV